MENCHAALCLSKGETMILHNEQEWTEAFTTRLKAAMKKEHISNKDLGELVGVGENSIINYRRGVSVPNLYTAAKIASVLDISLDNLAGVEYYDEFELAGFDKKECMMLRKLRERYNVDSQVLIDAYRCMRASEGGRK